MPYNPEQIQFRLVDEKKKERVDFYYLLNAKLNHNCILGYPIFVLIPLALAKIYYSPAKQPNLFSLRELSGPRGLKLSVNYYNPNFY